MSVTASVSAGIGTNFYFRGGKTFLYYQFILMKNLFYGIALLAFIAASHQSSARELSGAWKETARSGSGGSAIAFTDTMRIQFLIGNEYTWSKPMGFIYRGTYKLSDKALDMGSRYYTIVEMKDDRMILSDKGGQYTFVRDTDAPRADQSAASHGDRASHASDGGYSGPPRSIGALMGKWEVYKRTASEVQKTIDYSRQLRVIELKKNDGGEQGLVFAANDMQNKPSWYMERYEDGTIYCKGRDARQLKVLHLANGELVIGEGDVTYFFKQFKQ